MQPLPDFLTRFYPFKNHPTDNYYTLRSGFRLHFIDEGSGHPVILLHGNPTWSFFYRNLIAALKPTYRALALDHLGCGLSDKPQTFPYRLADHIQNTIEWFEALKLERFSLILHDWGGPIGLALADHAFERLDKLVLLNTAGFLSKRIPWRIGLLRLPKIGEYAIRKWNLFVKGANTMAVQQPLPLAIQQGYAYPYNSWENRIALARFVQAIPLLKSHPSYSCLQAIESNLVKLRSKPVLICWGGKDFCFNDSFYQKWRTLLPSAEAHYFPSAGHYLLEDAGEAVSQHVQAFLQCAFTPAA